MRSRFGGGSFSLFMTETPRSSSGSALLAVLWLLAFLSFLIVTTMMVVMQGVSTSGSREMVFRARQLAEQGLSLGVHPAMKATDPMLHQQLSGGESFDVVITSEESRLNINAFLTDDKRQVLERLFGSWGLDPPDAQTVVDCLMDWVDQDDFKRMRGAEHEDYKKEGYPDRPYNRPFASLDEMELVLGMDLVAKANPNWREAFTLWGAGAVDINEASAPIIAAVANVMPDKAQSLVSLRDGPDGVAHTPDDLPVESIEQAMTELGANPGDASIAGNFTLKGTTLRVRSVGRVGGYARGVDAVVQSSQGGVQILEWREFVP